MHETRWSWLASSLLVACSGTGSGDGGPDGTEGGEVEAMVECSGSSRFELVPFRDEWRLEADVAFDHQAGAITTLTVGGPGYENNFFNRGDVVVQYDAPEGRIVVEMRRFTFAASGFSAAEDFDAMVLWAYDSAYETPQRPADMLDKHDCVGRGVWRDGCGIRVYYDGQAQLARAGADLRVHLPPEYVGEVVVYTEDNDAEGQYPNRGDVCIDGLPGKADVSMENGVAFVRVADDVAPTPTCPAQSVDACETWPTGAWANECPCIDEGHSFGGVTLQSRDTAAVDATVDLPAGLWSAVRMTNEGAGQDTADPDTYCEAFLDLPDPTYPSAAGNDFPWQENAVFNVPSEVATVGAGYYVHLTSSACAPVESIENPADFSCDPDEDPPAVKRGTLRTCEGCLGQSPCDQLLL